VLADDGACCAAVLHTIVSQEAAAASAELRSKVELLATLNRRVTDLQRDLGASESDRAQLQMAKDSLRRELDARMTSDASSSLRLVPSDHTSHSSMAMHAASSHALVAVDASKAQALRAAETVWASERTLLHERISELKAEASAKTEQLASARDAVKAAEAKAARMSDVQGTVSMLEAVSARACRCAVLCCAVLCCAVLCCAVLCCAVLCAAVPCRSSLRCCAALSCDMLLFCLVLLWAMRRASFMFADGCGCCCECAGANIASGSADSHAEGASAAVATPAQSGGDVGRGVYASFTPLPLHVCAFS
jgi:hypothetical protein